VRGINEMKTVNWWLDIGFADAARSGEVEVDDDTFSGKEKIK
jgi:hypothetical protein